MPLLPYALTRPFLFGLDAEAAHELIIDLLARGQRTPLQWAWCNQTVDDPIELAGLRFPNRVGLAAGLDKNARGIDALGAMGFGFVEAGTLTPHPHPRPPPPPPIPPAPPATPSPVGSTTAPPTPFLPNRPRPPLRAAGSALRLGLNIGKNASTPM